MQKVILINGFKRAGKDTVAKFIKDELVRQGESVEIMSMATPLKRFVCTQFEISMADLEKWKNSEEGIWRENAAEPISNFRRLLQKTGDAIKELAGTDMVFGQLLGADIESSAADFIIVPDFRYQVELAGLYAVAAEDEFEIFTIRVESDRIEEPPHDHASEWDLIDRDFRFDDYIQNHKLGTLNTLKLQCIEYVKELTNG